MKNLKCKDNEKFLELSEEEQVIRGNQPRGADGVDGVRASAGGVYPAAVDYGFLPGECGPDLCGCQ